MVRKAKWNPLEWPLWRKIVNQKQYYIPEGIAEISVTIKNLKDSVVIPTTSSLNSPIFPGQKTDINTEINKTQRKMTREEKINKELKDEQKTNDKMTIINLS